MTLKLIVGADLLKPPLTGIGYYAYHLLQELLKTDPSQLMLRCMHGQEVLDRALSHALLERLALGATDSGRVSGKLHVLETLRSGLRTHPGLYRIAQTLRLSLQTRALSRYSGWVQHSTAFVGPRHPGPQVITVHDLSHLRHPEMQPYARVEWLKHQLPANIDRAARIITVSEFVKGELLESGLVADATRITAIPLGFDPGFHPRDADELGPALSRWELRPGSYVLAVATQEPRKNFVRLLDAYGSLPAGLTRDYPLVLTGTAGWQHEELRQRIARIRSSHRVVVTGYVTREAVRVLMAGAAVFAYPSLYEGFGLPVLEAMASGTPVLTADRSSLQEVAGTAALCVDPTRTEAIRDGLQRLLEQPELAQRLAQAGLQRSTEFSWQRCAQAHLRVYRGVV